jgi:hypothetical protein
MPSRQRFKTWNIFDSALDRQANGHHHWEAKALVDELVRRGETVRLFSHQDAPAAEQFSGGEIVPTFSLSSWTNASSDPARSRIENFVVHNDTFQSDLSGHDPSQFHDSLILCPTLKEDQLLGLLRWLNGIPPEVRPKAAICLFPPRAWSPTDHSAQLYKALWKGSPLALREQIAIFCRTRQIAETFRKHTGMPARVLPFVAPEDALAARRSSPGSPMVVSFVGGARRERGGALVADAVEQCAGLGVRFFIQAKHGSAGSSEAAALAGLSGSPHVQLHEGMLGRDDYYRAIADSVVLLAYRPSAYRWRASSVYHEALLLDAPVLVSAGTWMAEEVKSSGNGLVIEHFSSAAIVDCIARAQRELPALRAAAARVGAEFRRTQGVSRYIDAVAGAFESSGTMDM